MTGDSTTLEAPAGSPMKEKASGAIATARADLVRISHAIHATPELAFEERHAHAWLVEALGEAGFEIQSPVAGMETAFCARASHGPLRIAICAEYDALPGLGHACGHNLIAGTALGAGIGLLPLAEELGLDLRVIGTPAEENGGGKIRLIDGGAFDGVHAAMMVHPGPYDFLEPRVIGVDWIEAKFVGKASHASASPHLGINAADAVVLSQVAIGLLRQHVESSERVHGIIVKAGEAPNVIPDYAEATYMVRGPSVEGMEALRQRVEKCFGAGALATGATLKFAPRRKAYAPMRHDPRLTRLYAANAKSFGRSFVDATVGERWAASTDMGNVSQVVPSLQPMIAISSLPATNHEPGFAAAAATPTADEAMIEAATTLAFTVIDAATDAEVRRELMGEQEGGRAETWRDEHVE